MRRFWLKYFLVIIAVSLPIFIYTSFQRPEIVNEVFREKITSPPAIFTAFIFFVGTCVILWKKLKPNLEFKGE